MHSNLLTETISILGANGKSEADVLWIGDENRYISWLEFSSEANKIYYNDRGRQEVNRFLKVVGKDFWLERHMYDGKEFWEYKEQPTKPSFKKNLKIFEINSH
jgi:hypothetical protein